MLISSRNTHESVVVDGEDGVHHPQKVSLLEAEEGNMERGGECDLEVRVRQSDMLERIRVAAGQTS
jgi:hypothetical protein